MRSRPWVILLWVLGILFPMAVLGRAWPAWGRIFDALFAPAWMHLVMHALLYAVLGFLLAQWRRPDSPHRAALLVALAFLVGVCQEAIQLVGAGIWPGWGPEILDLAVDLSGTGLGLLLARLLTRGGPAREGH